MITLTASAAYGFGGKQFVARILGRDSKFTFRREFVGRKGGKRNESCEADLDEPGLYETRDIVRKGDADDTYYLLMEVDGELRQSIALAKDLAMSIAKERALDSIVYLFERPSKRDPSRMVWDCEMVTARQAEQRAAAQTIDSAVRDCWVILQGLPQKEAKRVIDQLRKLVSPAKTVVPLPKDTPVGIVNDAAQDAGVPLAHVGMTATPVATFAAGDEVERQDDHDGAHFLVAGQRYRVSSVQVDDADQLRLCLEGMARAWEARRFRKI